MTDTYRAHRLLYRTLPPIILAVLWVSTGVEIGHALTNIREETSEFVSSVLLLVITLMLIKRYNNKNTARPRSSERSLLAAMFPHCRRRYCHRGHCGNAICVGSGCRIGVVRDGDFHTQEIAEAIRPN